MHGHFLKISADGADVPELRPPTAPSLPSLNSNELFCNNCNAPLSQLSHVCTAVRHLLSGPRAGQCSEQGLLYERTLHTVLQKAKNILLLVIT